MSSVFRTAGMIGAGAGSGTAMVGWVVGGTKLVI